MNKRVSDELLEKHRDNCDWWLEQDGCGCSDMVREYNESSPKEQAKWSDPPTYCTECQWWIDEKALFVELQERRAGDAERDAEIERKSLVNKNLRMSIEIMQDNADVEIAALNAKLAQTRGVLEYVERYQDYWRDQPVVYWLGRLIEEIGELSGTLIGSHKGPVGHELRQIASICINWLDYWQLPMCGVLEGDDAKTSRS